MVKKEMKDILVNEKFFIAEEAVRLGLADRIETFEEFQDTKFSNANVNEIKIALQFLDISFKDL